MTGPLDLVLSRLRSVKPAGQQFSAPCPAHDDRRASLSIGLGRDGRVLLYCHAGCSIDEIVRALGLKITDLFPHDDRGDRRDRRGGRGR